MQGVPPDYRDQVTSLDDHLPPPRPPQRIPLERNNLGFVVTTRFNGEIPARLVVDTGATSTVISPALARRLGLRVRTDPPVIVRGVTGTAEAGWASVQEIEVGGRRAGPIQVVVHDAVPGADGLLGMNFLGSFRVEILAEGPSLTLSPL